ncbi:hypothetical protein ACFX16_004719 [Malus domestica]
MFYGTECWMVKYRHVQKMSVTGMRMFRRMYRLTRKDKIKNEDIQDKVGVTAIEDKMRENQLRRLGHVNRRLTNAPVRTCDYKIDA